MPTDLELALRIKADLDRARKDLDRLTRDITQQGKASKKAAADTQKHSRSFSELAKNARKSERAIGNQVALYRNAASALGLYAAVAKTFQGIRVADHMKQIETRVRRATEAQGDFNAVWGELVDISNENGQAIDTTVRLFEGINLAAPAIGATRDEVLSVARAVQQLGVMSGTSGAAMANSMLQFSQAMAEGVVRAEEYNSIVTNTPAIAKAIADGLGLQVDELRTAVRTGKILSKDVFAALLKQAPGIAEKFKDAPNAIERAGQAFSNNMARVVTEIDRAVGVTNAISIMIQGWSHLAGEAADALADMNREESAIAAKQKDRLDLFARQRNVQKEINELRKEAARYPGDPLIPKRIAEAEQRLAALRGQIEVANVELRLLNDRALKAGEDGSQEGGKPGSDKGVPNSLANAIAEQTKANDTIKDLVDRRRNLLDELGEISKRLSGPADIEGASTSANVFTLNRLRGSAQTKFETGDVTGGLEDLERAKTIVQQLAESGQVSKGYLQTQVDLVRDLADELKNNQTAIEVPVKPVADADAGAVADVTAKLQAEFERQNPGFKFRPEFDETHGAQRLQAHLANLQRIANANPITAELVIKQAGGLGERFSLELNGRQVSASADAPLDDFVEQLELEQLKAGAE